MRLPVADKEAQIARGDLHLERRRIWRRHLLSTEADGHNSALTGLQLDACEALEFGSDAVPGPRRCPLGVQLHHLCARWAAVIADSGGQRDVTPGLCAGRGALYFRVTNRLPRCVGELPVRL